MHLEALKLGMQPIINRAPRPLNVTLLRFGLGLSGMIVVFGALYYLLAAIKARSARPHRGRWARWCSRSTRCSVQQAARSPDLPDDIDIDNPKPLDTWPTVRAGLHFLMPIGTLIWCLMVEEMSPALSAFWAIAVLVVLMLTQRPLIAMLRQQAGRRQLDARLRATSSAA